MHEGHGARDPETIVGVLVWAPPPVRFVPDGVFGLRREFIESEDGFEMGVYAGDWGQEARLFLLRINARCDQKEVPLVCLSRLMGLREMVKMSFVAITSRD